MREYELVREIFNECANNQMRDVFFEEVETADPEKYVKAFLKEKDASITKDERADGTLIYDVDIAGLRQRFTFTPV